MVDLELCGIVSRWENTSICPTNEVQILASLFSAVGFSVGSLSHLSLCFLVGTVQWTRFASGCDVEPCVAHDVLAAVIRNAGDGFFFLRK